MYLPAITNVTSEAPPAVDASFTGAGELVLIVDDEVAIRETAGLVLTRLGCTPVLAGNADEALALIARHGTAIRVVITDLHMPRIDGLAFVAAMRRTLPAVPVIVSSGRLDETAAPFRDLGVRLVLDKPFTKGQLAATLRLALDASGLAH